MHRTLANACWALVGAAAGSAMQSLALTVSLLVPVGIMAICQNAGRIGEFTALDKGRKKLVLVLILGILGGAFTAIGSWVAINSFQKERVEDEARRNAQQRLTDEVITVNQRSREAEDRHARRMAKLAQVTPLITAAITTGTTVQYNLEHARNMAMAAGTLQQFDAAFDDGEHFRAVENWRGSVRQMLDRELPGLGLGDWFHAIDGVRGAGRSGFRLGQMIGCIQGLQTIQLQLRNQVEVVTQ